MSAPWVHPWRHPLYADPDGPGWIMDANGEQVGQANGDNAEEVARVLMDRANAYPKLVEALEEIAEGGGASFGTAADYRSRDELATIARAALASTKEEG